MRYLEYERASSDLQHLHNCPENRNTSLLRGLLRIMMSFAFKKFTGRMNSSRIFRFLLVPQFRLFGTLKPNNLNAGGSAICIHKKLFLGGAVISHVITCQGRDHIVSIHSCEDAAQTVKYRRHVNGSHQLLPGSNAVSVYLTCLDCRHHAKWTHRTGPHSNNFRNCSKWFRRGGQNCKDDKDDVLVLADGWNNVLTGPCCACAEWSGCLADQFFVCGHLSRRSPEQP